jgi:hypothetical protein
MKPQNEIPSARRNLWCMLALIFAFPQSGSGTATIVDIATNATDPSNLADTEPSIAVNPANPLEIAVVTFSEGWGPGNMGPVWRSADGGVTWTKQRQLPQPNPSSGGPGDQKIAFDATGKLYVVELALGMPSPRLFVYRQTGASNAPLTVGTVFGSASDDQPHVDADQSSASSFLGRLYSPWLDFNQPRERSTVAFSTNSGSTLTSVGAGNNTVFPNRTTRMAIDPNGRAYIIYKTREGTAGAPAGFENAHFTVNRSDNGGATWTALGANGVSVHGVPTVQTFFTTSFGNPAKGKVARARSSDAWIAVDPGGGDVYAAYVSRDASGFGQIFVARSINGGSNWTSTRVTDGTHHCAYPEIAVAANGAIGVLYIDYDDAGPATLFRHRLARSFNNGSNWSDQILQSMDPGPLPNASSGFLWGDYEGVTAVGCTFYGVFTGASIARTTSQLDPIFFKETAATTTTTPSVIPTNVISSFQATSSGKYVCAENAGAAPLVANRPQELAWEQFQVLDVGSGNVALRSLVNGKYVCAENAGASPLIANRNAVGTWEQFQLLNVGGGNVALLARVNGLYVSAGNAGDQLIANRNCVGGTEQFILNVSLRSFANGKFVCAENAGASPLIANRTAIGTWEQFQLWNTSPGYFALKAKANGLYVCAENAGNSPLIANRGAIGTWENFQWIPATGGRISLKALVNGRFVCAENAGASPLIANRTSSLAWEQFY